MLEPSTLHTTETVARQVCRLLCTHERRRHFAAAPGETVATDPRDHIPDQVLAALRRPRIGVFEIGAAAVIGHAGVEGRVRLRIGDGRWSLATIEASIVAVLLQVEPDLRGADRFAAAFRLAAVMAEQKVAEVHAQAHGTAA